MDMCVRIGEIVRALVIFITTLWRWPAKENSFVPIQPEAAWVFAICGAQHVDVVIFISGELPRLKRNEPQTNEKSLRCFRPDY